MRLPRALVLAGLGATAVAIERRLRSERRPAASTDTTGGHARAGWATCSAPSARWYELVASAVLGGLYRRMADDLAAGVVAAGAPEVLEIGPGPGILAVELGRRVAGLRLSGLDVDPAMVDRARIRARREGLDGRLTFEVGDVAALPFPHASFDVVISSFSVHHWSDPAGGFAEIRRVLRPGGRAIIFDLSDHWGRLERSAPPMASAAVRGGFPGARTQPFRWPGPIAVTNRLELHRGVDPRIA